MEDIKDDQIEICFEEDQVRAERDGLAEAVRMTLRRHDRRSGRVSIAVVDDTRISELNERYLGRKGSTDCLSFDLRDDPKDRTVDAEIVVSRETARREARRRGIPEEAELTLYVVHGVLHLLGYDDRQPERAAEMHGVEDQILTRLGFGPVYGAEPK